MKEPLLYLGKDKKGNFVFKRAGIADILIEATGLGELSRAFDMNIKNPLIFINKRTLKWIEEHKINLEDGE